MSKIQTVSIDIETFSDIDLNKCGVYRYCESPSFRVLLFGYSANGGEVRVVDLEQGEKIPDEILDALTDDSVMKWSHNVNFERVCLSRYLSDLGVSLDPFHDTHPLSTECARYLNPESWRCSMVWSAYLGLPLSLKGIGSVLKLENQKLDEGKALIKYFSVPCAPTKANGGRTRNLPSDAPEKWELFKSYNKRDVEVEMAIQKRLSKFPVPEQVWEEYKIDQEINDRGVLVDMDLVHRAISMDRSSREELTARVKDITGLENPNSVQQMKRWLSDNGLEMESLGKKEAAAAAEKAPGKLREVLELRTQLAKSSVKKYQAMERSVCSDNRARGMFQFYGASRSGRWAGKILQLQNLPRNSIPDLEEARKLVKSADYDAVRMLYGDVPDLLSQLVRTAFVPRPGCKFIVADFSAIEARVIAWLAGEKWKTEAFAKGEDIYCATASKMFGKPVVKNGVNGELRAKGKVAELACLAEGQPVLTNHGLIPIERVTTDDLLWDGEDWVKHDGVICKGEREVITYDGLTATPDHSVWAAGRTHPITLGAAAAEGVRLVHVSDNGTTPDIPPYKSKVYDIINAGPRHRFTVSGRLVHNCGYGGSVGALKAMGALETGLSEDELPPLVSSWRDSNPHVVKFWRDVDSAAMRAVKLRECSEVNGIRFSYGSGFLFITLPSGRRLSYVKPGIGTNRFGSECITYEGTGTARKWERIETYGPKLVENIVQAVARDILCYAMQTLRHCRIVMHIHDELVIEADSAMSADAVCEQMGRTPPWAKDLKLRADGYECEFYRKD